MEALAVVVLAAGKGKRIGHPELPKVLLPLRGRPLLHYVLESVRALQPERCIVVVGFRGEQVEAFLRHAFPEVEIVWQREQLGTGHAVLQTEPLLRHFSGTVLMVTGDTPLIEPETLRRFVEHHRHSGAAVSVLTALFPDPTGYGRILRNGQGKLLRIVEDRDATEAERAVQEVNTGILAAQAAVLYEVLPAVRPENAQREYYLTDLVELCHRRGMPVEAWMAERWEQFQGVNTLEELRQVEQLLASRYACGSADVHP